MATRIEIRHWIQEGRPVAIGQVSINEGEVLIHGAADTEQPDCEKLATLYAIRKTLSLANSDAGRRLLPLPATAILEVAEQLVSLRLEMLKSGKGSKGAKKAKAAMLAMQQSPNRWVRAVAAGMSELLK